MWSRAGDVISNSTTFTITERESRIGGRNFLNSFLHLCDVREESGGQYECSVSNGTSDIVGFIEVNVGKACVCQLFVVSIMVHNNKSDLTKM